MRMCWLTPKFAWGSSLKLEMEKLGCSSQSSAGAEELLEASLATSLDDRESRVAVSVALSLSESLAELSFAFSGVSTLPLLLPELVANKRVMLILRIGVYRTGRRRVRSVTEGAAAFAPPCTG
jgi:hypothetical protein